jgi:hypothetical protein
MIKDVARTISSRPGSSMCALAFRVPAKCLIASTNERFLRHPASGQFSLWIKLRNSETRGLSEGLLRLLTCRSNSSNPPIEGGLPPRTNALKSRYCRSAREGGGIRQALPERHEEPIPDQLFGNLSRVHHEGDAQLVQVLPAAMGADQPSPDRLL